MMQELLSKILEESKIHYSTTKIRVEAQAKLEPYFVGSNILDIGVGDGLLSKRLKLLNPTANVYGISGNPDELTDTGDMHYEIKKYKDLDLIICRHVIEHSIMPFYMLYYINKAMVMNGRLILVVPEDNQRSISFPNHYSVLSKPVWRHLLKKSGYLVEKEFEQLFRERDKERVFICKKVCHGNLG